MFTVDICRPTKFINMKMSLMNCAVWKLMNPSVLAMCKKMLSKDRNKTDAIGCRDIQRIREDGRETERRNEKMSSAIHLIIVCVAYNYLMCSF